MSACLNTLSLALILFLVDDPSSQEVSPLSLEMTDPIACRSIRGYEDYEVLDPVEVTPDEKLLIYIRPRHHNYIFDEESGQYRAHLTEDVNLRQKGQERILFGREKVVDLKVESEFPPVNLYLGTTLGLKAMPPGDYEADLILKDALRPGSTARKTLAFRILPRKEEPALDPEGDR